MNVVLLDDIRQHEQADPAEDVRQALRSYASAIDLLRQMYQSKAHCRYLVDDWDWFSDTTFDATVLRRDLEQAYINGDW